MVIRGGVSGASGVGSSVAAGGVVGGAVVGSTSVTVLFPLFVTAAVDDVADGAGAVVATGPVAGVGLRTSVVGATSPSSDTVRTC
ncbi:hypothetical protein [Micromonospora inyonensis]|uniref:Uncharacterized protein n=1 Tax=Micromonospora inyonensis TaxID=47866 RepID=A0A1C6RD10_9ACTN|nr:hypothetical protein [Micromonospora inyonensis]SCL15035.1 hypothetical protein GA0074694_1024 [Micromonospora inyonensis]